MRTITTIRLYRRVSNRLVRDFLAARPDTEMSSREGRELFAAWLSKVSHERDWSKSSWRQARAAVISAVTDDIGEDEGRWLLSTINAYDRTYQAMYGVHRRWSARPVKEREMPEMEFRALLAQLDGASSMYAKLGSLWLKANLHAGLRPKEWATAQIDEVAKTLTVRNAKNTNGRSHGPTRTLHMGDLPDEEWEQVCTMAKQFAQFTETRSPEYLREKVKTAIYRARNTLREQGVKIGNISLYSSRHQFVADLRASGRPPQEIAAMLGHATTDTQRAHYGLKAKGRRGVSTAQADPEDIARVRVGKDTLAAMGWVAKQRIAPAKD